VFAGRLTGALLLVVLTAPGCAVMRMPDQLDATQLDIQRLEAQVAALREELLALRGIQEEQRSVLRELRADQSTRLGDVEDRIAALEELLRYSTERFDRVGRQINRIEQLPLTRASSPADTVTVQLAGGEQIYDAAYSSLLQGRYPAAIVDFREYLSRFPDGDLADNSQYWIGESYYAQSDYQTAVAAFLQVRERYPDSDKVPAALLKAGVCYAELGQTDRARQLFAEVLDAYPYSDEAIKARDRLGRLDR